jgi:hypothetical protein
MLRSKFLWIAGLALALSLGTPAARADQLFFTPSGALDSKGDPVNASANFAVTDGQIVITLTNLLVNQKDVGQNITDLFFSTVNGTLPSAASAMTSSANLINVDGSGNPTSAGTDTTGWAYTTSSPTDGLLNGLAGAQFVPARTILGAPNGSGVYSNANGSIAGNSAHNPFVNQVATYTITGSGITTGTSIANVIFSFGTTAGDNIPAIPEPSTMAIAGLGTLGFLAYGLRRRMK